MRSLFYLLTMTIGLSIVDAQESKKPNWWGNLSQATSDAAAKTWAATKEKTAETWEDTRSQREAATKATSDAAAKTWAATKEKTAETWEVTKEKTAQTWEDTRSQREAAAKATSDAAAKTWAATKEKTAETWEDTRSQREAATKATSDAAAKTWSTVGDFYDEHETAINTAAVAAVIVGAVIVGETYFGDDSQASGDSTSYSSLNDHPTVGPGKFFTSSQKDSILSENLTRNNGVLRSDLSGEALSLPGVYSRGYTPSANEAQIDHIFPRSLGGTNSFGNAQVLSREENLIKGATAP